MLFHAENTPKGIESNIYEWLEFYGVDNPPEWLQSKVVDDVFWWAGSALLTVALTAAFLLLASKCIRSLPWMRRRQFNREIAERRKALGVRAKDLADSMIQFLNLYGFEQLPDMLPTNMPEEEALKRHNAWIQERYDREHRVIGAFREKFYSQALVILDEMEEAEVIPGIVKRRFAYWFSTSSHFSMQHAEELGAMGTRLVKGDQPPPGGWDPNNF